MVAAKVDLKRRKTCKVYIGKVAVGGGAAVSIQSMAKTDTGNLQATIKQIKKLEDVGCELVRVAVKNKKQALNLKHIKSKIKIPLIADIHFDYLLALEAIGGGVDKIRINPGNMKDLGGIKQVAKEARLAKIPIRLGLNSGSVKNASVRNIVEEAIKYMRILEKNSFYDIIISLKFSNVLKTVQAYRKLARACEYPFHLGITASGPYHTGVVKSSIAIGSLLLDGIGDTIRVSLTADPIEEVIAAKRILQSLGLREFYPEVISCPTCGRCQVDLFKIVKEVEEGLNTVHCKHYQKLAIMGCEVNGPGEAKEADIGIAAGKKSGMLFKKGRLIKKVQEKDFAKTLIKEVKNSRTKK